MKTYVDELHPTINIPVESLYLTDALVPESGRIMCYLRPFPSADPWLSPALFIDTWRLAEVIFRDWRRAA